MSFPSQQAPCADWALLYSKNTPKPDDNFGALRFTANGETLIGSGYLPYLNPDGTWNQKGMIRFWRADDGVPLSVWDQTTGIGVTSGVALSPDGTRILYGTYEGTVFAATEPF
jgi:hypothetical protein